VAARFSTSDLDWFARVGHDRNPLHADDEHGRRSPFGGRVVHGILAALTAMSRLPQRADTSLKRVVFEFQRPMFPEVDYEIAIDEVSDTKHALRVLDGSVLHARGMVEVRAGRATDDAAIFVAASGPPVARTWSAEELRPGLAISVPYGTTREAYAGIDARFGIGAAAWQTIVLVGTSFVVGMHLPGERALFSRLELDFVEGASPRAPLVFDLEVKAFDARIDVLRIGVRVRAGDAIVATGELQAFARARGTTMMPSAHADRPLDGKTALVVGASRGLGAAFAVALAARGAKVVGTFARSTDEARALESASRDLPGSIELAQGDGRDAAFCEELKKRASAIDFLFCNASPALKPLWIEPSARTRIEDYVADSVRLFATPLSTFMPMVTRWVVASSSIAVRNPVAEWPHYVAAKSAIEGLVHVAAKEYPKVSFLVARPPALLTEFAPNLGAKRAALPPERVAEVVVSRLLGASCAGAVETLETF
jgi:NAD(P)-dependent dehydrogenase (short-subunit alcohol dehydrogenase family)/acyl dehydratase